MNALHEWKMKTTYKWLMSVMHKCNVSNTVYDYNAWIIDKCYKTIIDECNIWMKNTSIEKGKIIAHKLKKGGWDIWYIYIPPY